MNYSYIILNAALDIKNARNETVHSFAAGERVKIEATTEFYWVTAYGAVWFKQAKLESQHMFELNR